MVLSDDSNNKQTLSSGRDLVDQGVLLQGIFYNRSQDLWCCRLLRRMGTLKQKNIITPTGHCGICL
jgi:hypothetical protein